MPRKHKANRRPHWSDRALEDAIAERKNARTSFRELAKKYNVPKSTLERHINGNIGKQGRKPVSRNCYISCSSSIFFSNPTGVRCQVLGLC